MLEKENQTLKLILDAFTEDEEYARKQKILVAKAGGIYQQSGHTSGSGGKGSAGSAGLPE